MDAPRGRRTRVVPDGAGAARARLEGRPDVRRGPQALPPAARRPGGARRRLRRLPRRGHLLPARRTQRAPRPLGADTRLHRDARGRRARGPGDPEAVLAFLYGADWRIPDPAFSPVDPWAGNPADRGLDARRPHPRGHLERDLPQPARQRSRASGPPSPSGPRPGWSRRRLVADLGSGSGRDSAWFHARGHRVVGFDYSGAALRQTRQRLRRRGDTNPDVRALAFNDLRAALLAGAELAREPEPPYLYARGLVGCLDLEARTQPVAAVVDVAAPWRRPVPGVRRHATGPAPTGPPTARQAGAAPAGWSARSPPPVVASSTARSDPDSTSSTSPTRTSPGWRSVGTPTPSPTRPRGETDEREEPQGLPAQGRSGPPVGARPRLGGAREPPAQPPRRRADRRGRGAARPARRP